MIDAEVVDDKRRLSIDDCDAMEIDWIGDVGRIERESDRNQNRESDQRFNGSCTSSWACSKARASPRSSGLTVVLRAGFIRISIRVIRRRRHASGRSWRRTRR